jgi:hypothetical protein
MMNPDFQSIECVRVWKSACESVPIDTWLALDLSLRHAHPPDCCDPASSSLQFHAQFFHKELHIFPDLFLGVWISQQV